MENNLNQWIERNDITKIIQFYKQIIINPDDWITGNIQQIEECKSRLCNRKFMLCFTEDTSDHSQSIAIVFYPDQYIHKYYSRSFGEVNEATKLSVLIAARHGHSISREMVANWFPFQTKDKNQELKLRYLVLNEDDRMEFTLQTPYSLNYSLNHEVFRSEKGNLFLKELLNNSSSYDPLMIMNAGYVKLGKNYHEAYQFFMKAGQAGMSSGYIEAAGLVLRANDIPNIFIDGIQYYQQNTLVAEKIKEILSLAGIPGRWELATLYRYHRLVNENNENNNPTVDYYTSYFNIIEDPDCSDPRYSYELGQIHVSFGHHHHFHQKNQANSSHRQRCLEDYETALSFFVDALNHGGHYAHAEAKSTATRLFSAMQEQEEDAKQRERRLQLTAEIEPILTRHEQIQNDYREMISELVDQLVLSLQ